MQVPRRCILLLLAVTLGLCHTVQCMGQTTNTYFSKSDRPNNGYSCIGHNIGNNFRSTSSLTVVGLSTFIEGPGVSQILSIWSNPSLYNGSHNLVPGPVPPALLGSCSVAAQTPNTWVQCTLTTSVTIPPNTTFAVTHQHGSEGCPVYTDSKIPTSSPVNTLVWLSGIRGPSNSSYPTFPNVWSQATPAEPVFINIPQCPAGTWSPTGSGTCTPCTNGLSSKPGSTSAASCNIYTISGNTMNGTSCQSYCSGSQGRDRISSYSPASPSGTVGAKDAYQPTVGPTGPSGSCQCVLSADPADAWPCRPDTYSSTGKMSLGLPNCQSCLTGQVSSNGATNCSECSAGTYANRTTHSCVMCPAGTFAPAGSAFCSGCPPGTTQPSAGSAQCLMTNTSTSPSVNHSTSPSPVIKDDGPVAGPSGSDDTFNGSSDSSQGGLPVYVIAAVVVGCVLIVSVLGVVAFKFGLSNFFCRTRRVEQQPDVKSTFDSIVSPNGPTELPAACQTAEPPVEGQPGQTQSDLSV